MGSVQKKILFITQISPFPTKGGDRLRSSNLVKAFIENGYCVDAIIGNEDNIALKDYERENLNLYEYPLFAENKVFHLFVQNKRYIEQVEFVLSKHKYHAVFLDYGFLGHYISIFKSKNIPVIYGTHNAQSNLTAQWQPKSLKSKASKYIQVKLQRMHEKNYFNRADKLVVVSDEDKRFHNAFVDEGKIHVIPNFLDERDYVFCEEKENYIVMSGNFKTYQNSDGLKWFLEKIWDEELSNLTRLLVVGKGSNELGLGSYKNVEFIGEVDDIKPFISKAKIAIVPLLHGSGSRLKILEAMALKTLIISTNLGAEGIEHEHTILVADDSRTFKSMIMKNLINNELSYRNIEKAYNIFKAKYTLQSNSEHLYKCLSTI